MKKAFTFLELIIVVIMISVMVALALPFYQEYVKDAKEQVKKAETPVTPADVEYASMSAHLESVLALKIANQRSAGDTKIAVYQTMLLHKILDEQKAQTEILKHLLPAEKK